MKKLRKLSLQQLDKVELGKRQEGLLLGGGTPVPALVQEHHLQLQIKMLMTTMVIPLLVPMKSCVYAETVAEIQLHRIYNA
jgi:natural product precursor